MTTRTATLVRCERCRAVVSSAEATNMIRHGASLAEIAEVLRHRSQTTTAIYTHVSFEALRTVAQPWPTTGGDR